MAVSQEMSTHNGFLELWLLKTSVIQEAEFALGLLSHFDFPNPVVFVSSHLPSEEHSQEKISKDSEKEGFDIFISPQLPTSPFPSISLASCLMIHHFPRLSSN